MGRRFGNGGFLEATFALTERCSRPRYARRLSLRRSSALRADERGASWRTSGSPARSAVEPSFERHRFAATSSSRTRGPAAHHRHQGTPLSGGKGGASAPCGITLNSRPVRASGISLHPNRLSRRLNVIPSYLRKPPVGGKLEKVCYGFE